MDKKTTIAQSILWAAAILVSALSDSKEFVILMLVILATMSIIGLQKK